MRSDNALRLSMQHNRSFALSGLWWASRRGAFAPWWTPLRIPHVDIFHAPAQSLVGDVVVVYVDLETSGLDVLADEILEVAATTACSNAQFSTTVRPIEMPAGPGVHGICDEELLTSPPFDVVFHQFVGFLRGVADHALADSDSSSEDDDASSEMRLPSPKFPPPAVVLAAHNGALAMHQRNTERVSTRANTSHRPRLCPIAAFQASATASNSISRCLFPRRCGMAATCASLRPSSLWTPCSLFTRAGLAWPTAVRNCSAWVAAAVAAVYGHTAHWRTRWCFALSSATSPKASAPARARC